MSAYAHVLLEHPSPIGANQHPLTSGFVNVFEERVLLRVIPLLDKIDAGRISLILSPSALEYLAKTNWVERIESAREKLGKSEFEYENRLQRVLALLTSYNGSVLNYYRALAAQHRVHFVVRPLEGIDFSCWVSTPGVLDFSLRSVQRIFETHLGCTAKQISLLGTGYTPLLDAVLHDAGFDTVFVDSQAYQGAQSKLPLGLHCPVLNPTNGIALCGVDATWSLQADQAPENLKAEWRYTHTRAIVRDEITALSQECHPVSSGATQRYDSSRAASVAAAYGAALVDRLRSRLTRKKQLGAVTLTTILLPESSAFWCEEIAACESLFHHAKALNIEVNTPQSFLARFPEQSASWLGAVISSSADSISQQWLPRRLSLLYEQFRGAQADASANISEERLERIARLLLFAQISMHNFGQHSMLPFMVEQTPASLLDLAQAHLGGDEQAEEERDVSVLYSWASNTSLLRAASGD